MPLPLILGIGAAIAGATGVGSGIHGGVKMKNAKKTMKFTQERYKNNVNRYKTTNQSTVALMDEIGNKELEILKSFKDFADVFKRIQNKPIFKNLGTNDIDIKKLDLNDLEQVSVGAGLLLGGLGGAAVGTAGGFAAAGATTTAVMALGTASTGTAISTLSGVAATNATLAALGGGAIYAGGGGMALGSALLSASTIGVGLLIGGVIFNFTGSKLSNKADKAEYEMLQAEKEINIACEYLNKLSEYGNKFNSALVRACNIYKKEFNKLRNIVVKEGNTDFADYCVEEQTVVNNCILLVGLLYEIAKTKLVLKESEKNDSKVNVAGIDKITMVSNDICDLSEKVA